MRFQVVFSTLFLILAMTSCKTEPALIYANSDYADLVETAFQQRKVLADNRASELFDVFNQALSQPEEQALKFLFAYMPLSDLADYSGEFFLEQVKSSLEARAFFSWGNTIPELEFRHFVLPYRINNENLDLGRLVFFEELKSRVKDLNMLDAALEVNHWCHEKVTYRGTDIRTSAPLATLKSAFGRCGEESTFTVAALRAVSIPARQVYTPRWAHSDDNHAWVEFWADGKWHFLGACEPAPGPNQGWFSEPARRAMLINTKAFGNYQGDEWVSNQERQFSWINTLGNYAEVKELFVKVSDLDGDPIKNAQVEFQLYNYAEFFPLAVKQTNELGLCSFLTGFGDLLVWAHTNELCDYQMISVAELDTLKLILDVPNFQERTGFYTLQPPVVMETIPVSENGKEENTRRLKEEDAIRTAYEATFRTTDQIEAWASKYKMPVERVMPLIQASKGNYVEIEQFLIRVPQEDIDLAIALLHQVSEKDLRDTKSEVLMDHFLGIQRYQGQDSDELFDQYVLNPRVATEMLVAYREFFVESLPTQLVIAAQNNPGVLVQWMQNHVKLDDSENYYETPISPRGVFELGRADLNSARIFSVAVFRSLGVPARIEPGTGYPQYWFDAVWKVFDFQPLPEGTQARGVLKLRNDQNNAIAPKYHIHFTIAQFKAGKYHTLHFDWEKPVADFAQGVELDAGQYLIVTGNRQSDGSVLNKQEFFELKPQAVVEKLISLPVEEQVKQLIATLDLTTDFEDMEGSPLKLIDLVNDHHTVLAWIDPDKEPTKHTFQDMGVLLEELNDLNLSFVFIIPKDKLTDSFNQDNYLLPDKNRFVISERRQAIRDLSTQYGRDVSEELPVFVITDQKGNVSYLSSGYKIGIGEEIIKSVL